MINKIVKKIDFLIQIYNFDYYSKYKNNNLICNFSKTRVIEIQENSDLLEKILSINLELLNSIKNTFDFKFSKYFNQWRIKNIDSIYKKIDRYCKNNKTIGKSSFNKCLNDFIGFRLILEFDLNKLFDLLKEKYSDKKGVKILISKKTNVYKAIHIYIKKDNFCLPWEIQIWEKKDKIINDEEHFKKYGRY